MRHIPENHNKYIWISSYERKLKTKLVKNMRINFYSYYALKPCEQCTEMRKRGGGGKGNRKIKNCSKCTNIHVECLQQGCCMYKFRLTSILDGSSQVKNMKVPFLRGLPWKILRNVDRADSSMEVGALILGEIASSMASQKVLPSTSLTRTICNDFSKGAAIKKSYVSNFQNLFQQPLSPSLHSKKESVIFFGSLH